MTPKGEEQTGRSEPLIRRVRQDLFFVEWGNVRFGGTFSELATFAAQLQAGMTKALAGDPEDKRRKPLASFFHETPRKI